MAKILTWPGPVILIAREKRSADGRWVLKAQDQLGFDVTAWVRFARGEKPEIVSFLTPQRERLNARQRRELRTKFSLSRMLWDWAGCAVDTPMPVVRLLDADQVMPGEEPPVRPVAAAKPSAPRPLPPSPSAAPTPADAESPRQVGAQVVSLLDRWLTLDKRDGVTALWTETMQAGDAVMAEDVKGLLTDKERAALGFVNSVAVSLRALADKVATRVLHTGTAVRDPLLVEVAS
jgi:hypothetical protein